MTNNRTTLIQDWLSATLKTPNYKLQALKNGLSPRQYFRILGAENQAIFVDAPHELQNNENYVRLSQIFTTAELPAPKIYAQHQDHGFFIIEDFGDELLFDHRQNPQRSSLYQASIATLLTMQRKLSKIPCLELFDEAQIQKELNIPKEWFFQRYLKLNLSKSQSALLDETAQKLAKEISALPRRFIHRDFHSQNLMVLDVKERKIGVIDFQDAMMGPFTYDFVSLIKDCYLELTPHEIAILSDDYYQGLDDRFGFSFSEFQEASRLTALQRHLKALGIFTRSHFRDQKSQYLPDIPRVLHYIRSSLEQEPSLASFHDFMVHATTRLEYQRS